MRRSTRQRRRRRCAARLLRPPRRLLSPGISRWRLRTPRRSTPGARPLDRCRGPPDHLVAADAVPSPSTNWWSFVEPARRRRRSRRAGAPPEGRGVHRRAPVTRVRAAAAGGIPRRAGGAAQRRPACVTRGDPAAPPGCRSISSTTPAGWGWRSPTCRRCATAPRRRPTRIAATPSSPPNRSPTSRQSSCRSNASGAWRSSDDPSTARSGDPPRAMRLASVHLENTASARRLRVLAQEPRRRQAQALLAMTAARVAAARRRRFQHVVRLRRSDLQGDGGRGARHRRRRSPSDLRRVAPARSRVLRLPDGWTATATRLAERFGSDHYPILARVRTRPARPLDAAN